MSANRNKTEIAIILDRSGSMESIREDMEGGFRAFVTGQRQQPGECVLSLYQFDDQYEVVYEAKPLARVRSLRLRPRGMTALLDAVGKTIVRIAARHDELPKSERPAAVIVLIITDGHENASVEWTKGTVRKRVAAAIAKRDWRFVFLGADLDAFADAREMGISTAARYAPTRTGVSAAYEALECATSAYRSAVRDGDPAPDFPIPSELRPSGKDSSNSSR